MHRFYSDSGMLSPEDAHHALTVLRLTAGSEVEWITCGERYRAVIDSVEAGTVRLRRLESLPSTEPKISVTLFDDSGSERGTVIPQVHWPCPLKKLPDLFASLSSVVVPWEDCHSGGPLAFCHDHPGLSSLGIVIGPEGGISPEEIRFMKQAGACPVTLGKRILRTETAGIAAVSALFAVYGEME